MPHQFDLCFDGKRIVQAKSPSLSDYDFDRPNDDNDWLSVALDRWGDRRVERRIPAA